MSCSVPERGSPSTRSTSTSRRARSAVQRVGSPARRASTRAVLRQRQPAHVIGRHGERQRPQRAERPHREQRGGRRGGGSRAGEQRHAGGRRQRPQRPGRERAWRPGRRPRRPRTPPPAASSACERVRSFDGRGRGRGGDERAQPLERGAAQAAHAAQLVDLGERARGDDARGERRADAGQRASARPRSRGSRRRASRRARGRPAPRDPDPPRAARAGAPRPAPRRSARSSISRRSASSGLRAAPVIDGEPGAGGAGEEEHEQQLVARVERHGTPRSHAAAARG